jgi:hypothetical protein
MNSEDFNESVQRAREACTPAQRAADIELQVARDEICAWADELKREGHSDEAIRVGICENLEERLARLYCEHYELQGKLEIK